MLWVVVTESLVPPEFYLFIYLFCLVFERWEGSELGWGPKDGEEGMDQKGFRRRAHWDLGMKRDGVAGERNQGQCY